jgi:CheY-like chemotaxis protein
MIRRNVELEARLIDDLLDLTRISRGKVELNFSLTDVHEKLRHVMDMCASEATAKSVALVTDFHASRFIVEADVMRLQQVFWNLLRNAIKFTNRGDQITIRTRNLPAPENARELVIDVIDTGIGIEPEALRRVFDAFEQGGREITRAFGGLGLGLTISKAMIELHHGQITATSDGKNRGATFTVSLPLRTEQALPEEPPSTPVAPLNGAGSKLAARARQILLVEDHADTSRATARLLTQCGYAVQTAATVADAIRAARSQHFDLIISDIGLPDGTGHDLIRRLVAEAPHGGETVRGIAISGFGQPSDLQRSEEAGFVEHLIKPVNPQTLLDAVDEALE